MHSDTGMLWRHARCTETSSRDHAAKSIVLSNDIEKLFTLVWASIFMQSCEIPTVANMS